MINFLLALGTLAMQIASAAFLALFFLRKKFPDLEDVASTLREWGLLLAFLFTLGSSVMALLHEYIFGLPPCSLCWWQRIFIFPQVALFGIALWNKDASISLYSIVLSGIGLSIALYHHALQMFPAGSLPCPSEGGVSCTQIFFLEFGYITYPMMSATLFAFLIILMLHMRRMSAAM